MLWRAEEHILLYQQLRYFPHECLRKDLELLSCRKLIAAHVKLLTHQVGKGKEMPEGALNQPQQVWPGGRLLLPLLTLNPLSLELFSGCASFLSQSHCTCPVCLFFGPGWQRGGNKNWKWSCFLLPSPFVALWMMVVEQTILPFVSYIWFLLPPSLSHLG